MSLTSEVVMEESDTRLTQETEEETKSFCALNVSETRYWLMLALCVNRSLTNCPDVMCP